MSEMIERVKAALAEAEERDDGLRFDRMARAAIEAMHEPTEAMVVAAEDESIVTSHLVLARIYIAMIDKALDDRTFYQAAFNHPNVFVRLAMQEAKAKAKAYRDKQKDDDA